MTSPAPLVWFRLFLAALAASIAGPAAANPDVWVTANYILRLDESAVTELTVNWRFDPYYSDYAIYQYDLDSDGAFSGEELAPLSADLLEPLEDAGYFTTLTAGSLAAPASIPSAEATIDGGALVITYTVRPKQPIAYRDTPISFSLHDEEVFFDFSLAEEDFLLVDGPLDPSCRFRVQRGEGLQKGHRQVISLSCEE